MATLELECPSCGELLELDAGFAGGVCRCSQCGTLMTVPAAANQTAEQLVRPERPDAPGGRPASPTSTAVDEGPEVTGELDHDATATATRAQTYTTASGRTVQIDEARIPTAQRRRPLVRATTVVVFALVMLAIVGGSIWALVTVISGPPGVDPTQLHLEQFGYDPNVNPYTLEQANVLGLPLRDRAAVVVDASGASRTWLPLIKDALLSGVGDRSATAAVGLVYATDPDPVVMHEELQPVSELDAGEVTTFNGGVYAAGVAPLAPAVERALTWTPSQLIVITGRPLRPDEVEGIEAALASQPELVLDVVLMGDDTPSLAALAEQRGGHVLRLSEGQLNRWYREAEETTDAASASP